MEKKTKPGAIQQLLDYAGDNKKQLYFSTFLATLGELFGMAPFIAVSLLVSGLFNKTATIQNVLIPICSRFRWSGAEIVAYISVIFHVS